MTTKVNTEMGEIIIILQDLESINISDAYKVFNC